MDQEIVINNESHNELVTENSSRTQYSKKKFNDWEQLQQEIKRIRNWYSGKIVPTVLKWASKGAIDWLNNAIKEVNRANETRSIYDKLDQA